MIAYIQNIIAVLNGQKTVIFGVLAFVFNMLLPLFGIHPKFSPDDLVEWVTSGLLVASQVISFILWVVGLIHKYQKGEINIIGLINAFLGKKTA
jgi:hypothetical protein